MYVSRRASPSDDLTGLFPEAARYPLNPEQVLLITEEGVILGAAVLFHGGHALAVVGAVRIVAREHPQWVARALWRSLVIWAQGHGVTLLGHGAGPLECREAMERLGGHAVKEQMLFEVPVP
jgi:hypothetical protein